MHSPNRSIYTWDRRRKWTSFLWEKGRWNQWAKCIQKENVFGAVHSFSEFRSLSLRTSKTNLLINVFNQRSSLYKTNSQRLVAKSWIQKSIEAHCFIALLFRGNATISSVSRQFYASNLSIIFSTASLLRTLEARILQIRLSAQSGIFSVIVII